MPCGVGVARLARVSGLGPCRASRASAPLPTPVPVQPSNIPVPSAPRLIWEAERLVMRGWRPLLPKQNRSNQVLLSPLCSAGAAPSSPPQQVHLGQKPPSGRGPQMHPEAEEA